MECRECGRPLFDGTIGGYCEACQGRHDDAEQDRAAGENLPTWAESVRQHRSKVARGYA